MHTSDRDSASFEPGAPDEAGGAGSLGGVVTPLAPPPALEERVVAALTSRGLLARPGRATAGTGVWRGLGALAAAAALFAAGVLAGRAGRSEGEAGAGVPRYALLLYEGPGEDTSTAGGVEAHRRWARELARRGHYVAGEKLGAEARVLARGGASATAADAAQPALSGFFIVSARSPAEAEAIARTVPHLRDGGRVVLRPVDPT